MKHQKKSQQVAAGKLGGAASAEIRLKGTTRIGRFGLGQQLSHAHWHKYYESHPTPIRKRCGACGRTMRLVVIGKCRTCYNATRLSQPYLLRLAKTSRGLDTITVMS